jgi:hypothetical protein
MAVELARDNVMPDIFYRDLVLDLLLISAEKREKLNPSD